MKVTRKSQQRVAPAKQVRGINRAVALLLGLVWLFVAFASIALGYGSNRWLLFAVALFAFWYALLWFRVVSRSRLLTWRDLLVPWRPE